MKYIVSIPITGTVSFEVEANGSQSAIDAAWKQIDAGKDGDVTWEFCDCIVEGNVFHGMQNEIETHAIREAAGGGTDGSR